MPDTHGIGLLAPITATEVEDEIWLEATRRHVLSIPGPVRDAPAPPVPAVCQLAELLALDGVAFIQAAYATVLGRAADDAGMAALSAALADGCDKLGVLRQMQASPEGRRTGRAIPGLRSRLLARRVYRIPVAGRLARAAVTAVLRSGLLRPGSRSRLDAPADALVRSRAAAFEAEINAWRLTMQARFNEQQLLVDASTRRVAVVQRAQEELGRKLLAAVGAQGRQIAGMAQHGAGLGRQVEAMEDGTTGAVMALADGVARFEDRIKALEGAVDLGEATGRIEAAAGALRVELDGRVIAAEAAVEQARRIANDQQRRIGLMLNALRSRVPATADAEDDHALDALYLQFEDRFRGSRNDIKHRQRVYLPRLRALAAGAAGRPVLDIGAGRGEFLELLREEGLDARGVDTNAAMAAACRDAGLACEEGDALAYLAAQPGGSLGAITGFHIVEHIPFKGVVRIMDEALRVLAPGGLIIFETPNPANILTASRFFYLDPTHRNPLPGEMMAMIAEARGFADPEILPLHPMAVRFPGADRKLASALDDIFHGPQDYALIARRP